MVLKPRRRPEGGDDVSFSLQPLASGCESSPSLSKATAREAGRLVCRSGSGHFETLVKENKGFPVQASRRVLISKGLLRNHWASHQTWLLHSKPFALQLGCMSGLISLLLKSTGSLAPRSTFTSSNPVTLSALLHISKLKPPAFAETRNLPL